MSQPGREGMIIDFEQRPWRLVGKFGPYQIQDLLSFGGMGTVYSVSKGDGVDGRRSALKVIRSEVKTDQFLTRFERERAVLSRLHHPNIVKFIDGGETPEGLPYLVMECVHGRPITSHCVAEKMNIDGRVRLFVQACGAVQYLHEQGLVHRDLKPSNIFVTTAGTIKLLDFGIAKSFSDPEKTTAMGLTPFTPEYASPEQLLGSIANQQSDVYSLGLILYRLLTGTAPFPNPAEVTRNEFAARVLDTEPAAPSTALGDGLPEGMTGTAGELRAELSGTLDAITLRALRLRASERYPTASALARDLAQYLEKRTGNTTFREDAE